MAPIHNHRAAASRPALLQRAALAALAAAALAPLAAPAQGAYPSKPIRVVVTFGAGTSPDVTMRLLSEPMSKALGQPVVVDNKPGASTIIGAQAVASAPGDGYTLLYTVNNTTSINPYVYKSLPYKPEEFVPVIRVLSVPYVVVTSAQSPYKTLGDLLAAAKANPGKLNYGSYGIGQGTHVAMARLLNAADANMVHVPYKDNAVPDLVAGLITTVLEPSTTAIPHIQGGKIRALAVTGPTRVEALPDVPAVSETYKGFVGDSWHGLLAPKGTPAAVVNKINETAQRIIATPEFQKRLKDLGLVPAGGTPADFQQFLKEDTQAWAKVVRDNDIKVD
ncbi:Bug family tripartite tricarboxylate transporter substrate binding protein [Pseudorhodoferax sp.]|uniref:Bug family tripartite tricarboxylate transporter substrate binding protein n=1 Tax=Pseudorhodoferax sp. TaxID=1993553 RepID=UPI0039E54FAB